MNSGTETANAVCAFAHYSVCITHTYLCTDLPLRGIFHQKNVFATKRATPPLINNQPIASRSLSGTVYHLDCSMSLHVENIRGVRGNCWKDYLAQSAYSVC